LKGGFVIKEHSIKQNIFHLIFNDLTN